ncbi:type I-E CRISPR-associated protein Cse2/CasB [Orrella sp. 11846]|uniref:type I-E CRISPR-associated protein Cse2/CasB n=1 Tax=Orrella sp. 11846 TaxID=3409913 RepID=UPI003B5CD0B1
MEQLQSVPMQVKKSKEQQFVQFIIERCKQDKGFAARLRRADNPATEYQSWEVLGPWVDLENKYQRLPYAAVAAAIGRAKVIANGNLSLGKALANAYAEKGSTQYSDQAKARLRRLLACDSVEEVCRVIRPVLTLIDSKGVQTLDYSKLLSELRYFGEKSKIRWAQDFYGQRAQGEQGEDA